MQLDARDLAALCELIGVASLCSWTVCLAVGLGLCTPDRALLLGVPGTLLGGLLFRVLGWPVGPAIEGYPIVPALVGTTLMLAAAAYVERIREDIEQRRAAGEDRLRVFRVWRDDPEEAERPDPFHRDPGPRAAAPRSEDR